MNASKDPPPPAEPARGPGRALPLLLIAAGALFLLLNAGIAALLWRVLLPVALLAFGMDLLTEGRQRQRIAAGALVAIVALAPLVGLSSRVEQRQAMRLDRSQRPATVISDIDRLNASIKLTAGSLQIAALDDARDDTVLQIDPAVNVDRFFRRAGRRGILTIDPGPVRQGDYRLAFAPDLPLDLTIEMGAGEARSLDFSDLQLERLNLRLGAGNAAVTLPSSGVMDVTINSGAGEVVLDVPDDLEARVTVRARIGDVDVDDRFELVNGAYVTQGWSGSTPNRAEITVNSSVGGIRVR